MGGGWHLERVPARLCDLWGAERGAEPRDPRAHLVLRYPQDHETGLQRAGAALAPTRSFILVVNQIGNGLSTSPHNTPFPEGGPAFPQVRIGDDVRAQYRLATERFGLEKLALVVGGSMGAQPTYEWCVRYPDFVARAAPSRGYRAEFGARFPLYAHPCRGDHLRSRLCWGPLPGIDGGPRGAPPPCPPLGRDGLEHGILPEGGVARGRFLLGRGFPAEIPRALLPRHGSQSPALHGLEVAARRRSEAQPWGPRRGARPDPGKDKGHRDRRGHVLPAAGLPGEAGAHPRQRRPGGGDSHRPPRSLRDRPRLHRTGGASLRELLEEPVSRALGGSREAHENRDSRGCTGSGPLRPGRGGPRRGRSPLPYSAPPSSSSLMRPTIGR